MFDSRGLAFELLLPRLARGMVGVDFDEDLSGSSSTVHLSGSCSSTVRVVRLSGMRASSFLASSAGSIPSTGYDVAG